MRILLINCVYAIGSTGKIIEDIKHYCESKGDNVLILYGRHGRNTESGVVKVSTEFEARVHSIFSRLTGLDFGFSPFATAKTISKIKKIHPDVVHLHCLNGHFINVYELLKFLKESEIPTLLTLHAEIMHTAGCEHAYDCMKWRTMCHDCQRIRGKLTHYFRDDASVAYQKMQDAFSGFKYLTVVCVSNWLTNRASQSAIFKQSNAEFVTIENGLDLKSFRQITYADNPIKDKFKKEIPIVLHVTPNFLHPLKGGVYVLELAKKHPEWQFVIVGYNGHEELPSNVMTISHTQSKEELSWYYNIADVTLLTSKRETFSMVCAESLACGTPVVGFKAGGPESVFIGDFAKFVDYGDIRNLEEAIKETITNNPIIDTTLINKKFSAQSMANKYRLLYEEIIHKK